MLKHFDFERTTLADILRAVDTYIRSVVDKHLDTKLHASSGGTPTGGNSNHTEKPLTTEEACKFLNVSKPVLRQLVKAKIIPRHKFVGLRGYRFFASELVHALKSE